MTERSPATLAIPEDRPIVVKHFLIEEFRIRRSSIAMPAELPVIRRVMRAVVERDEPVVSTPVEASV